MQTNNYYIESEETIHFGHLGAIALCAVFLVSITFMKNGFSLNSQPLVQEQPKVLTYEEARQQVLAERGSGGDLKNIDNSTDEAQYALINPSAGQVAGASTDLDFPTAEQIFTPQVLGALDLNIQSQALTQESLQSYAYAMAGLEAENNTLELLSALSSENKPALEEASFRANKIFDEMQYIPVPKGIEEYHKYKMFFYQTLGQLADVMSGKTSEDNLQQVSVQLFSLISKLDGMKADLSAKYGVKL
jgi:hypothetical protein